MLTWWSSLEEVEAELKQPGLAPAMISLARKDPSFCLFYLEGTRDLLSATDTDVAKYLLNVVLCSLVEDLVDT